MKSIYNFQSFESSSLAAGIDSICKTRNRRNNWQLGLLLFLGLFCNNLSFGQTYYSMSSGNYSQTFAGLSTAYPTNFNGLAVLATGSIPIATKTTVATNGTLAVVGTSTALGYDAIAANSTKMIFLCSGSTDNTNAVACDLNLNFTGRTAGNLAFDYACILNTPGAVGRASSLVVYYSLDGTTWNSLGGPYTVYNTTGASAANVPVSITLPAALNNQATVKFRFYEYNGGTVVGTPGGSRAKISLDNIAVSSTAASSTITPSGNLTGLTYIFGSGPSTASPVTLSASALTAGGGNITITGSTNFEVSTTSATTGFGATATMPYTGTGTIASNSVWVRLKAGLATATYPAETISISGGGATASFTVAGSVTAAAAPTLTPSVASITGLNYTGTGPSGNQSFNFSGANLTGSGNITALAPTNFEVSTDGVSFFASVTYAHTPGTLASQTVYVRLKTSLPAATYGPSNLTLAGGGATTTNVSLTGTATAAAVPTITPSSVSLTGYSYLVGSGPSTSQSFTFTGVDLTGFPSNITVTGSTNYEVSTNNSTFFASVTYSYTTATLTTQTVYVRLKTGLSAATYSENITISGGGITPINISNSGSVASPFSLGNLVVSRMGATGQGAAPTSAATAIFYDEYSTTGTSTTSFALPTTTSGSINRITGSGSATSENTLNLSVDGRFITIGGYDLATGTLSANSSGNPRVIMRTDKNGTMSSTAIGFQHTSGFRGVTSFDGSAYWSSGNTPGVNYVSHQGSTTVATPTLVTSTQTNLRCVSIFNNQLYYSTGSSSGIGIGIKKVGTGLPTTTLTASTNAVPATGDPYQFYMVNRGTNKWNCYVAYQIGPGIYKFSSSDNGATWTARGSVTTSAVQGLVAKVVGANVEIYGSSAANIIKLTDVAAYDANISATSSNIATAPANTFFRGLAFAPAASGITVSNYSLSGFNYEFGNGPSTEQSFTVNGASLTGNISLTAPTNYEISLSAGSVYASSLSIAPTSGTVAATTIYVRLKTGLASGLYNDQAITCTATGAYTQTVYCSGGVLPNVNLSVSSATGTEVGTSIITLTATSSGPVLSDQTVDVTVTGTGLSAGDYTIGDGDAVLPGIQIKISTGSTTGSITITLVDDNLNEGNETATITISNSTSGFIIGSTANQNITITDNDDAVILPTIDVASTTIDFNDLITLGTSTEVSRGAYYLETGTNQNLIYSTGDGSSSTGETYSFGSGVSTERALGSTITSGLADVKVGFKVKNSTGASFNAMIVEYYGEQWRRGLTGNAANGGAPARDKLRFEYSTSATSLATGTWGSSSVLNFNSPDFGTTSTESARNGNIAPFRQLVRDTIFIPSGVAAGSNVWVRWVHNTAGTINNRDGLGIDDVTFTPINFSPEVYYSDAIGSLDQLSTWWTNADGTGANPINFTGSNQIFIVQNRSAASIGANWSVSGSNSSVRIRDGVTVTIPDAYSFVGKIDSLEGTSTLILNNANTPILNGIEATSTVVYGSNSNQDIAVPTSSNTQYGNLTLSGAGVKRVTGGFRIEGEYLFNAVSMDATPTFSMVFFKKNITHSGGITYSTNYSTYVNLQAYGSSAQQLIGNGSTIKAGRLLMNVANTSGTLITSGADLKTGSLSLAANTNLTLGDDLKLNTNAGVATFTDNANTITVAGDLECAGTSANYSFTGTMILNGAAGTANIRQDGASGSGSSVKAELNNLFVQTSGTTVTQVQPTSGGATLVINGEFRIAGTSTGKFTPNGNTIQIAGDFTDSRITDMIAPGTSTFEFNGSTAQNFATTYTGGESFYNVVINNPAGLTLTSGNMRITSTGNLDCAAGGITTGANKVILGSTASITETSSNNVLGNVESTRVLTNALNQFGGMGFEITALGTAPGSTVVLRNTGTSTDLGCTSTSLLRTFTVTPTVNSGLNAVVTYSYLNSDLNSIAESSLALYSGTGPYTSISTAVNVASNSITATGLNSLSSYVAAFASLPSVNTNSTTINASNPSRLLTILSPDVNTNYVWSPVSDLYTDSDLTIPYVFGASATTVYAAPFSSITYNVVATNTLIACSTSPVAIFVDVDPAITNDICAANSPAGLVSVTSTPTFYLRSLSGATASPGAACVAINKDVWFSAVVPSNGEIHVTTQEHNNATASLNITSALVQIFTATTCSTGLSAVSCNAAGAAANMAYAAATGLTPGSTVYIRLARTTANNAAPSQFIRMAVTKGLIWTGTTNSDFTNPGNYLGGDATSLTVPSSSSSVIIPTIASGSYPIIVGTQTCHGLEFAATFSNQNPNVTISSGAELRLQASATYPSFINRSGFAVSPKINGTGTLRFNEGGLNTASILCPVRFYGVAAVRNGVTVTSNGNMRFENNAVLLSGGVATAVPTQNYNGTVTGNIVYVRSGSLYGGYNYWSSPVTSANTDLLLSSFGNNIYQYNNQNPGSTSNTLLGWTAITTGTTTPIGAGITMTPGKGYIQTFAGNGTVTFTGAPNQTSVSIPTTINGSNNFNLLGNPYPAALSYDAFKASNASLGSVYLWSNVGTTIPYTANSYVVMSSLGLAGNSVAGFTAKEIGPAQGFLTNVASAGNINFSPNHVVPNYPGNTTQFLENNPFSLIRLRLSNANQISFDALVGFGETGTEGVDFGYDSPRMPSSDILEVYSLMEDQQYTTQFLPNLETARVVNLGTVMSDPGVHTFELNEFDNFDSSVRVYLEDALTGEFHNMNASSSYTFTNDLTFTGNRFSLHFMAPFAFNATGSCSNDNSGKVIISNPNENYPMSAKIKNLSGDVVAENDSIMTEYIFTSLTPGAYSLEASYDGQDMISNSVNIDAFQAFENISFVSSSNVVSIDQAIVEFSASESVNAQYTWNFGDGTILTGNSSVTHAYMQPGIFTVTLSIDNSGCVSTSSSEIIVTDVILGMSELANSNEIISFPNPANEQLNIFKSGNESASFEMTDVSGKLVLSVQLNSKLNNINTAQFAPGVYTGTMIQNESRKTIRIVIAH